MLKRCSWATEDNPLMQEYHDKEWGVPVHDDTKHFEFLILEGAQAGLSWLTILKRRKEYAKAFANFSVDKVALFKQEDIEDILQNSGVIRNRLKIESAVTNAKKFREIQEEFGSFDRYLWQFVGKKQIQNNWKSIKEVPPQTKESVLISKDLKKRGFNFVGPTIIYAHMQAVGLVNDHTIDCFRHSKLNKN